MSDFNLVEEPWIPVRTLAGNHQLVSLEALFRDASQLADLDCAPHERISLMRLLVCITQAELGAPDTPDDWGDFGHDLETRIPAYLRRSDIFPHFNLFGDGPRFLQAKDAREFKAYPVDQIVFHLASGNTSTLFDHFGGSQRTFSCDYLARTLLTYQNFFVGGSLASQVKGNGPSLKFLHTLLMGKSLRDSLILNCLDLDSINGSDLGYPSWSIVGHPPRSQVSLLERFSPTSCSLWLTDDRFHIHISQGKKYPEYPEQRDPYATIQTNDEDRRLLRANLEKGVWRDLHVVTCLKHADQQVQQSPLNLQSHLSAHFNGEAQLWLGELYKAKDAKVVDCIESVFTVPASLFLPDGRAMYHRGVEYADTRSRLLYRAIQRYGEALKQQDANPHVAQRYYWNNLDLRSEILLGLVREGVVLSENFGEGTDPWTQVVHNAALKAYEHACPRQTPRQIQAFATGLKILHPKSPHITPLESTAL